jgi:CRP-like cAMP-binding protein
MSEVSVRTVATGAHGPATGSSWRNDPFVARLKNIVDLSPPELESLRKVVESELTIKKRRDLILDGYEYRKLCFVTDGFAARYKLLRNGKRQIVNFVLPGDVVGLPGSFLGRAALLWLR